MDTETCFSSESYRESNEACVQETSAKCLKLKTYGDLRNSYEKFRSFGKNKKFARDCHITINPPLFQEDDEVHVIEKCVIPELHILQGYVNHLFWNGLVPLLGRDCKELSRRNFRRECMP
ncbi:unnamed protein product [Brassicogethes aeneus]|uniref:Uncharacterized protein n=1 Tax=Brassicogethes aeneus TaxID=1431903 RepID=A0A9P0AYZ2_BRAAE|nr:unnamed protein product [Brassicogethes aeneus]